MGSTHCCFLNGFLLTSIYRKSDVSVQFLLLWLPNSVCHFQGFADGDLMNGTVCYETSVSWEYLGYGCRIHYCHINRVWLCSVSAAFGLLLMSILNSKSGEPSGLVSLGRWSIKVLWQSALVLGGKYSQWGSFLTSSELLCWVYVENHLYFIWFLSLNKAFKASPVHHLNDAGCAYCMLSALLLWKDTKLLLQQPEYNHQHLVIKGPHSTSACKRGKDKVSKYKLVCVL